MSAEQLLRWLTEALFAYVFAVAAARTVRRPIRANADSALFFGALALIIALSRIPPNPIISAISGSLIMAIPYLLLRVLNDFHAVPRSILRLAEIGLACAVFTRVVIEPAPGWLAIVLVAYFFAFQLYAAARFSAYAGQSSGVARRRMQAVACGSALLGLTLLVVGLQVVAAAPAGWWTVLAQVSALGSGIGYTLGFTPPLLLRRAWQEPEVRRFNQSAAGLPGMRTTASIVRTLELGAAAALGAPNAAIGLWDDAGLVLRFPSGDPDAYLASGMTAVLAVPIAAGKTHLGTLAMYAPRAFNFAEDDLELAQLVADQIVLALGYARQLVERERAETETAERLRVEAVLSAIVESSQDAIVSETLDGVISSWNPGAQQLYGYTAAETVGQPVSMLVPPERTDEMATIFAALQRGERIEHYETLRLTRNGPRLEVSLSVSPLVDSSGRVVAAATIARDISDRKRAEALTQTLNEDLERRVLERTAELESAVAELDAFSYSVSHDLRAPLRAVSGYARILLEEHAPELTPDAQQHLHTIGNSARRMGQLIDDLLAFSRLGRQAVRKQPVQPASLVDDVLAELALEQDGRAVELLVQHLLPCAADPALLRQVFANLLANALKFTRRREVAHIEVGSQRVDGEVQYFIKDNGAGFDMRYADKLFGVFQRLHKAKDYEGTGVGLAIVQRIVNRHGGRVWATSVLDEGATFFFTLEGADAHGIARAA